MMCCQHSLHGLSNSLHPELSILDLVQATGRFLLFPFVQAMRSSSNPAVTFLIHQAALGQLTTGCALLA